MYLKYKSRKYSNIDGKPNIYFSACNRDYSRFFSDISTTVLKIQDCVCWYFDGEVFDEEKHLSYLREMNLFVIIISREYLTVPNFAKDVELPFAIQKHIPVLIIMQEEELDELFREKIGDLQYLQRYNEDKTVITYEEKLKRFFQQVLLKDEDVEKIHKMFDAHIFMSYRKTDRKYAVELMRLIHKNDSFRDIAIWYDEYLIVGEDFNVSIKDEIEKCDLFVLVVTPNVLNEENYIITKEYPLAMSEGKEILPVEMLPTDRQELDIIFKGILYCVNAYDDAELNKALKQALNGIRLRTHRGVPEYDYFIGLAYLNGVDVEIDRDKAVELIATSANNNYSIACKKMVELYQNGNGVRQNFMTAIVWQKKYRDILREKYEEDNEEQDCLEYLESELELAEQELKLKLLKDARNTCWRVIKLCRENGGYGQFYSQQRILKYVEAYLILGNIFYEREDIGQARECYEKVVFVLNDNKLFFEKDIESLKIIGRCYYYLSELFSKEPFYDYRYNKKYITFAISAFQQILEQEYDEKVLKDLANCYLMSGKIQSNDARYHKEAESDYLKACDVLRNLMENHEDIDICLSLCETLLMLGDFYADSEKAFRCYRKALNVCMECDSEDTNILRESCECYLKIIEMKCIDVLKPIQTEMVKEVIKLAEYLAEKEDFGIYQELLGRTYFKVSLFSELYKDYAIKAFKIYKNLSERNYVKYSHEFWICRKKLWEKGLLPKKVFQTVVLIPDSVRGSGFIDVQSGERYEISLQFIGDMPTKKIKKIEVSEILLAKLKPRYAHIFKHDSGTSVLQLGKCGMLGTRQNPMPEEFVKITFYGIGINTKMYQICYG